jgi:hypothetical protein
MGYEKLPPRLPGQTRAEFLGMRSDGLDPLSKTDLAHYRRSKAASSAHRKRQIKQVQHKRAQDMRDKKVSQPITEATPNKLPTHLRPKGHEYNQMLQAGLDPTLKQHVVYYRKMRATGLSHKEAVAYAQAKARFSHAALMDSMVDLDQIMSPEAKRLLKLRAKQEAKARQNKSEQQLHPYANLAFNPLPEVTTALAAQSTDDVADVINLNDINNADPSKLNNTYSPSTQVKHRLAKPKNKKDKVPAFRSLAEVERIKAKANALTTEQLKDILKPANTNNQEP